MARSLETRSRTRQHLRRMAMPSCKPTCERTSIPRECVRWRSSPHRLAQRLLRRCPACGAPGFGPVDVERGLPCECCSAPTNFVAYEITGCSACHHRERAPRRDGLQAAEQIHCTECNP